MTEENKMPNVLYIHDNSGLVTIIKRIVPPMVKGANLEAVVFEDDAPISPKYELVICGNLQGKAERVYKRLGPSQTLVVHSNDSNITVPEGAFFSPKGDNSLVDIPKIIENYLKGQYKKDPAQKSKNKPF